MRLILIIFSLSLTSLVLAEASSSLNLVDVFSVEANPGRGMLEYKKGAVVEKILIGPEAGRYVLGMVFRPSTLPTALARDFKGNDVVQLAIGTIPSRIQGQVPQFGAGTIITTGIPRRTTSYPLVLPSPESRTPKEMAFLLFTSPDTPNDQGDEEKLKTTYFAKSGNISITPHGKSKNVEVRLQNKKAIFKVQLLELTLDVKLSTPFNAQENTLTGKVEMPLYWPSDKVAKEYARKVAAESLGNAGAVPTPQTPSPLKPPRDMASTPQDKKRIPDQVPPKPLPERGM